MYDDAAAGGGGFNRWGVLYVSFDDLDLLACSEALAHFVGTPPHCPNRTPAAQQLPGDAAAERAGWPEYQSREIVPVAASEDRAQAGERMRASSSDMVSIV